MKAITHLQKIYNAFIYTFISKPLRSVMQKVIRLKIEQIQAKRKKSIQMCEKTVSKPIRS